MNVQTIDQFLCYLILIKFWKACKQFFRKFWKDIVSNFYLKSMCESFCVFFIGIFGEQRPKMSSESLIQN